MQFVEEPVEVEEGGGELVEDEGWAVEVDKRSLYVFLASVKLIQSLLAVHDFALNCPEREM